MKKDVLAMTPNGAVTRTSGFNGDAPINVIDQPPASPGMIQLFRFGPGGPGEGPSTPEQQEENRKSMLLSAKQDFARMSLGMMLSPLAAYPLEFWYGGQAESPDGKADIVEVKGDGDFAARLFIDSSTHLPLMLSWMAKEPIQITRTAGGPGGPPPGAGAVQFSTSRAPSSSPEERDKMMKQAQDQMKEAEAKARVVEYRLYYGDYRDVDGVKVPFKLQRSIDGKPTEEVTFDKVKINAKIDPKKFEVK